MTCYYLYTSIEINLDNQWVYSCYHHGQLEIDPNAIATSTTTVTLILHITISLPGQHCVYTSRYLFKLNYNEKMRPYPFFTGLESKRRHRVQWTRLDHTADYCHVSLNACLVRRPWFTLSKYTSLIISWLAISPKCSQ